MIYNYDKKTKTSYYEFNGTAELFDFIKDTPEDNHSRKYRASLGFCPYSWADSISGLLSGWREGTQEIQKIASQIHSAEGVYMGGHGIDYDVTGDFIDMGAYLAGEPECMGRIVPREIIKDEVHILVSVSFLALVGSDQIKTRGAAITALIEKLMENYEVKLSFGLSSVNFNDRGGKNIEIVLNIDLQNEYSRDVIAFCAAHPGYLRRCLFSVMERDASLTHCNGYGRAREYGIKIKELEDSGIKFYYFKSEANNREEWSSPENALKEVNRIVELLK